MDLMRRLKSAFIIIMVLPIFMIIGLGKLMLDYQSISIKNSYNMDYDAEQLIFNPMQMISNVTTSVFNKVKTAAEKSPEKLEDMSYIDELNESLVKRSSFIIVRKGNQIVYDGRSDKSGDIVNILISHGNYDTFFNGGTYVAEKNPFFFKQQDFIYSDGTDGTLYVVTYVDMLMPRIRIMLMQIIVTFMAAIIITAVILIVWLYRSILHPLNTLKKATNEIIRGNLDYSISGDPEDEIGQLCCDFEEMRVHLKELIGMQKQYEHDSRELISSISHDLKTPLTAIKGYAEGIIDGVADTPDKQERYIRTIYTKASDMTSLVDELSFFSEIDCKSVPYNFKKISISGYFEDCIEEISLDLEMKGIKLEYENLVDVSVMVAADAEQLKRVINNIIGNSIKYLGKDSGKIVICISQEDETVKVSIEDDGIGIARKDLPFIFDRFYRADESRNSSKGGTGLGLSIVRKIIEEHSGRIWAESQEGAGTKLSFILPVYIEANKIHEGEIRPGRKERKRGNNTNG